MERIIRLLLALLLVGLLILAAIYHDVLIDRLFDFRDQLHAEKIDEYVVGSVSPDNDITLDADILPDDVYTLWYENTSGKLSSYDKICTLTVANEESPVYTGLIPENAAPVEARVIGVYNSLDERVGGILLGGLKKDMGSKLYTFGALSDVHIGSRTSEQDFTKALNFLIHDQWAEFVCVAGDLTQNCTDEELATYQKIVTEFETSAPVYSIRGNHDSPEYRKDDVTGLFDMPLFYSFEHEDDVFIMLGNFDGNSDFLFTREEFQWFYETLEKYKDRRCFVFQHVRPENTSGNAHGIYAFDIWNGINQSLFESILECYPNVILFHGHSHLQLKLQDGADTANYSFSEGYHSVHIPSITTPRTGTSEGSASRLELPDESEGYLVDVYENGIMLRGRDFIRDQHLPIAQYYLDTTTKSRTLGRFFDYTCTIHTDSEGIPLEWHRDYKIQKSNEPPVDEKGYAASQVIAIEEGYRYRMCSKNATWTTVSVCFYDADAQYIDFFEVWDRASNNESDLSAVQEISVPDNATTMVVRLWYPPETANREVAEKLSHMSLTKWHDK